LAKRYRNGVSRRLGGERWSADTNEGCSSGFRKERTNSYGLDGKARDAELKSFLSADPWYRGAEVDNLSKQQAAIIAARLVRRVQAKVEVSAETAKTSETDLT
jgi:hypothetical protein